MARGALIAISCVGSGMRCSPTFALLVLAACSDSVPTEQAQAVPTSSYSHDPANGEIVARIAPKGEPAATLRSGPRVPIVLPAGYTLYPGATVVSNTVAERGGKRRLLLTFETPDPIASVIGFYRRQARLSGTAIVVDLVGSERASLGGSHPSGGDVAIAVRRTGAKTRVEFAES